MDRRQSAQQEAAAEQAVSSASPEAEDKYAALKELKELLDSGVLTEEEYAAEKAKILGD